MCSCETVWVKVLVSKGWFQSKITVQTLKWKKKQTEWEEGAGLRIWNFQGWSKKLKIFSWNSPFSVNIIRTL